MKIERIWALPNSETLQIKPIRALVDRYLTGVSIDPFARNCNIATITNDLNPETAARHHMKAIDFLKMLKRRDVEIDSVIFDPPYSRRQMMECYDGVGYKFTQQDSQKFGKWYDERTILNEIVAPDGVVMSFGWHTNAMGKNKGWKIEEILIVAHGGGHYDTLVTVEKRIDGTQESLL